MANRNLSVACIGAGVIGATTALHFKETFPNSKLEIISNKEFKDITSYGPAGMFRPYNDVHAKYSSYTFEKHRDFYSHHSPLKSGISMCSGYLLLDDLPLLDRHEKLLREIGVPNLKRVSKEEIKVVAPNLDRTFGLYYTCYMSHGKYYVIFLREILEANNVNFLQRDIQNLDKTAADYDVLINASGLGAGLLAHDDLVFPNRGITIQLDAPWLRHFMYSDNNTCCLPGIDCTMIGVVRQPNRWETVPDKESMDDIYARVKPMLPSIKDAKIIGAWAGLRPDRTGGPRIEAQIAQDSNDKTKIILHNYGHGGNGFETSWGTAKNLVDQFITLHQRSGSSKL